MQLGNAYSFPGAAEESGGGGSDFWHLFLQGIDKRQEKLARYNKTAMTSLLTFVRTICSYHFQDPY